MKELRIIDQIAPQWREAGILLGFTMPELETLQQTALNESFQCCRHVFSQWIANHGHPQYPLTWNGLHELLVNLHMDALAKQLQEALASKTTGTVVRNLLFF